MSAQTLARIAAVMHCVPADDDDFVEAVRLLVAELDAHRTRADAAEAECARLREYIDEATRMAAQLLSRAESVVLTYESVREERDAARAEADALRAKGARSVSTRTPWPRWWPSTSRARLRWRR